MITIRWASLLVFLICMAVAATGARAWILAGLAAAAFLILMWTFSRPREPRPPRPRRPVSNWFMQDIPPDHPDALGSLDIREREGRNRY